MVDVLMPAYNAAATLRSAVASIQAQTVRDIRIIIVNDGSTDATRRHAEQLAADDDRIVVVNQAGSGIVDALNEGLNHATADFIARHDADDLSFPGRLATQLRYFAGNADCVALSGAFQHIDASGTPIGAPCCLPAPEYADVEHIPQREPYLSHPFLMVRREAMDAVGGYRHALYAEDTDLYWRLLAVGRLHNLDDVLGQFRMHAQSVTASTVVNGRVSAVHSQRAGLSFLRRRSGKADLDFPRSARADYESAASLERMIEIGSRGLEPEEARSLAVSTCAKLVELAGHRAYELEAEDCTAINRHLLPALRHMRPPSRIYCNQMLSGTAARLVCKGRFADARKLSPLPLYPAAAAKLTLRALMPLTMRRRLREAIRGAGFMR